MDYIVSKNVFQRSWSSFHGKIFKEGEVGRVERFQHVDSRGIFVLRVEIRWVGKITFKTTRRIHHYEEGIWEEKISSLANVGVIHLFGSLARGEVHPNDCWTIKIFGSEGKSTEEDTTKYWRYHPSPFHFHWRIQHVHDLVNNCKFTFKYPFRYFESHTRGISSMLLNQIDNKGKWLGSGSQGIVYSIASQ